MRLRFRFACRQFASSAGNFFLRPTFRFFVLLPLVLCLFARSALSMPEPLYRGMIKYKLESGDYFNSLVMMDEAYRETDLLSYVSALKGFNINEDIERLLIQIENQKGKDPNPDYFNIGKAEYFSNRCVPALKAFKKLKNKLSLDEKQEWAFYRANCFIKLGSNIRAAEVLSDILGGIWASHAYYNLGIAYATASNNKTRALVALRVAVTLNEGETKEERELNDRINYAAGAIYLEEKKPDLAAKFFKKVHLDSATAPQALYLNGVSHLQLNDFRAATQSWFSVKQYPLIHPGVAEAMLAIPYAFERSGYVGQALEAYMEASKSFKQELDAIKKIDGLLTRYGAQKALIEENKLEGLQWFLTKDVVKNTSRASYYGYFMRDEKIYDKVELLFELKMLDNSLVFWESQLGAFDTSLKKKKKNFRAKSKSFHESKIKKLIGRFSSGLTKLQNHKKMSSKISKKLKIEKMTLDIEALGARVEQLKQKISIGRVQLKKQLSSNAKLQIRIKSLRDLLRDLLAELDAHITSLILERLALLKEQMTFNFERAEQGLVHIFEGVAESELVRPRRKNKRRSRK